jgi:hypothetical protein
MEVSGELHASIHGVNPRVDFDVIEKTKMSFSCRKSNPDTLLAVPLTLPEVAEVISVSLPTYLHSSHNLFQ